MRGGRWRGSDSRFGREGIFGGAALDEEEVLVGGLAADVAGFCFFEQDVPMLGGGLKVFPALHGVGDAAPANAFPAFENDANLILEVVLFFLPADVLAHNGEL